MYPFRTKALRVQQPLGVYYVAIIPAHILRDVAFSDRLRASVSKDREGYSVDGTQRGKNLKRPGQIADYIDRGDSAFPNTIILAANYEKDTGEIRSEFGEEGDQSKPIWTATELADGCFELVIPSPEPLAGIIDGQHRLDGFRNANPERQETELICSVFLDLPKPYQAQLFATINSTQQQVDKSLTYELFGYNIADEPAEQWTPDKLAVLLTRRLNTQDGSPLKGRVLVAPSRDITLKALNDGENWHVSTATVVEGILRLISANPKRDTNAMLTPSPRTRTVLVDGPKDRSPMRSVYVEGNDALLYAVVLNFLKACKALFWEKALPGSFIVKTVGIQALFDILRKLAPEVLTSRVLSVEFFEARLGLAAEIDFAAIEFQNASGSGRSAIRKAIERAIGLT